MELHNCPEILGKLDSKLLLKATRLTLNPPAVKEDLHSAIVAKYGIPQPTLEYIKVEDLERHLGNEAYHIFLCLDQIMSLNPELLKVATAETEELFVDHLRRAADEFAKAMSVLEGLKSSELRAEDEIKEEIMLIVPSDRQMSVVRGEWDRWLWGRTTYDYEETPNVLAIMEELINYALVLRREGIKVDVLVDTLLVEKAREKLGSDAIEIDIPPNLPNVLYVRDPSVTWFKHPIIGNMVLEPRWGEEAVAVFAFRKLGLTPIFRVRWARERGVIHKAFMEGGNFFVLKSEGNVVVITGIGVRGSNWATFKALSSLLPEDVRLIGIPLSGYIRDWGTGATHLDGRFSYLGDAKGTKVVLVDPSRIGIYSAVEYDRETDTFKLVELLKLMKELEIYVDEPPRAPGGKLNHVNLGRRKVVVDSYNEPTNKYIERVYGFDVIRISVPHIIAGGGVVRCVTREIWRN